MASNPEPRCADCRVAMEEGWVPDCTHGAVLQTHWQPGPPQKATFFGLEIGKKFSRDSMHPIRTFRCPGCGLLRAYAHPEAKKR